MCIVLKEENIKQKMVLFLISDRDCMICVTPSNEKTECCRQAIHPETCLRKWYETQEIHGLTHTCSLCRAQLHLICQKICPTDLCKTKKVRIYYGGEQQPAACTLETVNGMKPQLETKILSSYSFQLRDGSVMFIHDILSNEMILSKFYQHGPIYFFAHFFSLYHA